jgi:heptosyltransferase-2
MKHVLEKETIKKVLIRGVNWIGDTVITLPAIRGIRNLFPDAHLEILLKPHLAALLRQCRYLDGCLHYPEGNGYDLIRKEKELIESLRGKKFDLAVIFPRSLRSALIPYLARIPFRVGFLSSHRGILLTQGLKETKDLLQCHQVEYYYHIAQALGAKEPWVVPELPVGSEEDSWADAFLQHAGIAHNHVVIGINAGATYGSAKCWQPEKFAELARRLTSNPAIKIILIGGNNNASLVDTLACDLDGHAIKAVGHDLLNLAALLKRCHLVITNDTGPMHIAAAVGTPVVALFGSTNPATTGPLGNNHHIVRKDLQCSPCLKRHCPEQHACMTFITVDDVFRLVQKHLERYRVSNKSA